MSEPTTEVQHSAEDMAMFKKLMAEREAKLHGTPPPPPIVPDEPEPQLTLGQEADGGSQELAQLASQAQALALANRVALASRRAGRRGFWVGLLLGGLLWACFGRPAKVEPRFSVDDRGLFWVQFGGVTVGPATTMAGAQAMAFGAQSNVWVNGFPSGLHRIH